MHYCSILRISVQFSCFLRGWNFCFSHFVSTTSYFKKRNETQRFNAIYPFQHLFTCLNFALLQYFAYSVKFSYFCMFNFCFSHFVSTTCFCKNVTKDSVSTQFISFTQILRFFLQFCGFCVLVCNSVSFAMFNFCSSHSVSRLVT